MNGLGLGLTCVGGEIRLGLVGGYSSMVESKLVELVVAGSSPVGHPTSLLNGLQMWNLVLPRKVTTNTSVFKNVIGVCWRRENKVCG